MPVLPFPEPLAAVLVGFAVSQLANLATTVYLHRAAAHRAVRLRPPLTFAFRFILRLLALNRLLGLLGRFWSSRLPGFFGTLLGHLFLLRQFSRVRGFLASSSRIEN